MTNTGKDNRQSRLRYASVILLSVLVFIFYGCGTEIEKNPAGSGGSGKVDYSHVTLKGKVVAPLSNDLPSSRPSFALTSVQGTLVFLEQIPNLYAYANSNGDFIIENVPCGIYAVVAEKNEGYTVYKQRQDNVEVSGGESVVSLAFPIPLEEAAYGLTLHLSDVNTDKMVNGTVNLWGRTFNTFDGGVSVTPFPEGTSKKEAKITSIGYVEQYVNLEFGENNQSEMYIKLTPTTGSQNKAPVVAIKQSELMIYTDSQVRLTAAGYDPEGEKPQWKWSAEDGSFTTTNTDTVIYNTPSFAGKTTITLTGTDSLGASGKATLSLDIIKRGSEPVRKNRPPATPSNPTPANGSEHIDSPVVLTWNCSDPDGDTVDYSFFLGTTGANLSEIASGLTVSNYTLEDVSANTTYYWKVVATDDKDASSTSAIWRFTTGDLTNNPPNEPSNPYPENNMKNVDESSVVFSWTGGDPDGDSVSYYIYLATLEEGINALKQIGTSQTTKYSYVGLSKDETYYWRVKAVDSFGKAKDGPIWQFSTTSSGNRMPSAATPNEPADKATMVAVTQKLQWSASDPDLDLLYYDVYFGTSENPPLVSSKQTSYIYNPGNLEQNTTYYWRIVVSDGKLTNPESTVWSFTTLDPGSGDAPVVIAITTPSGSDGEFKIEFSTAMNINSMNTEIKFSPAVAGTWSWNDAGTIATFNPTQGYWPKGSYNKFSLAAGSISSKIGVKIAKGVERIFVVPSDVDVPSGYRSYGFPIELAANQSYEINLTTEIPIDKCLYMLTIAGGDNTNFVIQPSTRASISSHSKDPTQKFRKLEYKMLTTKLPDIVLNGRSESSFVRAAESDPGIGSTRDFYIDSIATTSAYPNNELEAKLVKKSNTTLIYADKAITGAELDSFASSLITKFDNTIYSKVRATFGEEPPMGPDGNARTKIVIIPGKAGDETLLGFFNPIDLYGRDSLAGATESNEGKIFYIIYRPGISIDSIYGVLAHEFQHMINYYQKNKSLVLSETKINEETWLNEGLSQYANDVCEFDIDKGKNSVLAGQILTTINNHKKLSVTTWDDSDDNTTYGFVYLFVKYIMDSGRYGSDKTILGKNLASGNGVGLTGEKNVEMALGEPFINTMAKFGLSLFLNKYNGTNANEYGIKKIDLKGTYSGITFPGFEIEKVTSDAIPLNNQKKNTLRCFKVVSDGKGKKTILIQNGSTPVTIWLFDERQ